MQTPFYPLVPTDPVENLKYRIRLRDAARCNPGLQQDLLEMCRKDLLFWMATFCWLYEPRPRPGQSKVLPFLPWPHQIPAIEKIDRCIGIRDFLIDKSRGQGATWICLLMCLHRWLFEYFFAAGLVSRSEEAVDHRNDPDCLMWKLDWELTQLPFWMVPRFERTYSDHTFKNLDLEGTIVGYAATGDVASGGRKTLFIMDEVAKFKINEDYNAMNSTQHVADCRGLVSTFKGDAGAYYDAATQESGMAKIVMDWRDNPIQNRGLYKVVHGQGVAVDKAKYGDLPPDYFKVTARRWARLNRRGFVKEGQTRSPWYDNECDRPGTTPHGIAQELDRDPHGSVFKLYDHYLLKQIKEKCCQRPWLEGHLAYDAETLEPKRFIKSEGGLLKLWCDLVNGRPAPGDYVLGADISAGTGGDWTSNSALTVIHRQTGAQAAEFASPNIGNAPFAKLCVAVCRWFHGAYLVWECNGPGGQTFTKALVEEIEYTNIFYRLTETIGENKKTRKPGWHNTGDEGNKKPMLDRVQLAMETGEFVPRSETLLEEMKQYEYRNGRIVHAGSERSEDQGNKGKAHGDRVIAAGMALIGCDDLPTTSFEERQSQDPPYGSMAWRLKQWDESQAAEESVTLF